ncbi:MAG: NADH-quinone oxidoreductase subunit NuoE [Rickettsiaceae bacterium]|nr:NADH-quinone oxidoreductase subunit NuoE [Rickettsiaceae bacterium]
MKNKKFIFTDENLENAKKILAKYPLGREKSAVLPLLDMAQRQNDGWISTEVIEYIADMIEQPYMRVYEVASFYSMFYLKPVGKYHIQVCGTTPCWLRGAHDILAEVEAISGAKCGNTSQDGQFTVTEVECLGACRNAPVVQINDDFYEDLDIKKIRNIVKSKVNL